LSEEEETMEKLPVIDGDQYEEAVRAAKNMVTSGLLNTPVADGMKCRTTHHGQRRMNGEALKAMTDMLLPAPLVVEREHPESVEALKARGATQFNTRVEGDLHPSGIVDFMNFYGMLPTPQTTDYNTTISEEAKQAAIERHPDVVPSCTYQLRQMAVDGMLPTPRSNVVNGCDLNNPKLAERNKSNLEEEVAKMVVGDLLPTPRTGYSQRCMDNEKLAEREKGNLEEAVAKAWQSDKESQEKAGGITSRLSPLFTEEMMGFPFLWTTLPFLRPSGAPKPSKPTEMR
jgi:hypothetical protein